MDGSHRFWVQGWCLPILVLGQVFTSWIMSDPTTPDAKEEHGSSQSQAETLARQADRKRDRAKRKAEAHARARARAEKPASSKDEVAAWIFVIDDTPEPSGDVGPLKKCRVMVSPLLLGSSGSTMAIEVSDRLTGAMFETNLKVRAIDQGLEIDF